MKENIPELELLVRVVNINPGMNQELKRKCPYLGEYAEFVERVRHYGKVMGTRQAVLSAVNECIREGILKDFLIRNKAEAIQMSIFEYDEEREMRLIRQDEREMGMLQGMIQGENRMLQLV